MTLTTVKPEIPCIDYWPRGIPSTKLAAYRAMIDAGQITRPRCVVQKATGSCAVSYASTIPHDWLRQEMAGIGAACEQIRLEGLA